jgi:hypothetical protein
MHREGTKQMENANDLSVCSTWEDYYTALYKVMYNKIHSNVALKQDLFIEDMNAVHTLIQESLINAATDQNIRSCFVNRISNEVLTWLGLILGPLSMTGTAEPENLQHERPLGKLGATWDPPRAHSAPKFEHPKLLRESDIKWSPNMTWTDIRATLNDRDSRARETPAREALRILRVTQGPHKILPEFAWCIGEHTWLLRRKMWVLDKVEVSTGYNFLKSPACSTWETYYILIMWLIRLFGKS